MVGSHIKKTSQNRKVMATKSHVEQCVRVKFCVYLRIFFWFWSFFSYHTPNWDRLTSKVEDGARSWQRWKNCDFEKVLKQSQERQIERAQFLSHVSKIHLLSLFLFSLALCATTAYLARGANNNKFLCFFAAPSLSLNNVLFTPLLRHRVGWSIEAY
jgi:hypothetical protein